MVCTQSISGIEPEIEKRLPLPLVDRLLCLRPLHLGLPGAPAPDCRENGLLYDGLVLLRYPEQPVQILPNTVDSGAVRLHLSQTAQVVVLSHFDVVPQSVDLHCEVLQHCLCDALPVVGSWIAILVPFNPYKSRLISSSMLAILLCTGMNSAGSLLPCRLSSSVISRSVSLNALSSNSNISLLIFSWLAWNRSCKCLYAFYAKCCIPLSSPLSSSRTRIRNCSHSDLDIWKLPTTVCA